MSVKFVRNKATHKMHVTLTGKGLACGRLAPTRSEVNHAIYGIHDWCDTCHRKWVEFKRAALR